MRMGLTSLITYTRGSIISAHGPARRTRITKQSLRAKHSMFFYTLLYALQFFRGQLTLVGRSDMPSGPQFEPDIYDQLIKWRTLIVTSLSVTKFVNHKKHHTLQKMYTRVNKAPDRI